VGGLNYTTVTPGEICFKVIHNLSPTQGKRNTEHASLASLRGRAMGYWLTLAGGGVGGTLQFCLGSLG